MAADHGNGPPVLASALAEAQARLAAIMESASDPIYIRDWDGNYLLMNQAGCEPFGLTPAEMVGRNIRDLVPPELANAMLEGDRQVRETGKAFSYELAYQMPQGTRFFSLKNDPFFAPDGTPVGVLGIVRDITDHKRLETALAASEAKLRAIIDHASDSIHIEDLDGRMILLNPAGAARFGTTPEAVIGRDMASFLPEDYLRQMRELDAEVISNGGPITREATLTTADGRTRTILVHKYPYCPDGTVRGIAGISRDISDRKELELELQAQNAQLRTLDRLKTDLIDTISHELRTPLTFITGFSEFLDDEIGGPLTTTQRHHVAQIRRGVDWLQRLVDDLLDSARIEAGTFQLERCEADLRERLAESLALFQPQAEEAGVVLLGDLPETPIMVTMDPMRIAQVVGNLVHNALKFAPRGGEVRVTLREEGRHVRCEVRDTGPGIATDDLSKLFNRFTQLESSRGRLQRGTGLGLSIAKAIIDAHGGAIGATSAPGAGATFSFTLPR